MRKYFLCLLAIVSLFMITGCKTKERTVEDLLDDYIVAYMNADVELTKKIFPPFYIEYAKNYMTKEYLEKSLNSDKEKLGNDFKITYEIKSKTKMTNEELEKINNKMENQFNAKEKATECYKLDGSLKFKGSKNEIIDKLSTISYCKYSDNWYLLRVYQ